MSSLYILVAIIRTFVIEFLFATHNHLIVSVFKVTNQLDYFIQLIIIKNKLKNLLLVEILGLLETYPKHHFFKGMT